jgi:hypothetical protein
MENIRIQFKKRRLGFIQLGLITIRTYPKIPRYFFFFFTQTDLENKLNGVTWVPFFGQPSRYYIHVFFYFVYIKWYDKMDFGDDTG